MSSPAPAAFFGQFLLERGAITGAQLVAAVAIQETTNVLLGTRAIDAGFMTAAQVDQVNALQRTIDRRFGEIAIEQGFLTADQLASLLSRQKEQRLMLGEALIKTGALDNARLATELSAFKAAAADVPQTLAEIYRGRGHAEIHEIIADVTVKMFLRILHATVVPGRCYGPVGSVGRADYTLYQRIKGDVNAVVCLDVSSALVKDLAGKLLDMEVDAIDADVLDGAGEFVNVVCGNVCARLGGDGRKVGLEPPGVHAWSAGPFDFGAVLPDSSYVATPLLHPDEHIELVVLL